MEKLLKNIYKIINDYSKKLKQNYTLELMNKQNDEFNHIHTDLEQQYLDYGVSIYKNIEKKELEFKEILDKKNETPYTLDQTQSKLFRLHIGMYNNGEIQTIKQISKKLNTTEEFIENIIEKTIRQLQYPHIQQKLLEERNIKDKDILIKKDISYLIMTENLEQILRLHNINTIEDILNITEEQLSLMNIQYGYNSDLILPPTRIIKQILNMGLKIKEPSFLTKIYIKYTNARRTILDEFGIVEHTIYIQTILDLLSILQFEPELFKTLDENEKLQIDIIKNDGYMPNQLNMMNQMIYNKTIINSTNKTINDLIKKEYAFLTQQEIDTIEKLIKNEFTIDNRINESEKNIEKTYLKEKN